MTQDRLSAALRSARVPRYTSYPPADRFSPEVGAGDAADWIAGVSPRSGLSLYLHVPFCRRLCWFCACRTQGSTSDVPIDRYLDHLEIEIGLVSGLLAPGVRVSRLHLGGGTPTILSPDRIDRLSDSLFRHFRFDPQAEIAVEIDPCECDGPRLDALARMGLGRVSVGVQDFDPEVQATIGRQQDVATTRAAVEGARARGVESINVDLVYGLPFQTEERLRRTLEEVVALNPDRLALYGYAHVPWMAKRQRIIPEAALPGAEARLGLAALAREVLLAAGYEPVGIDHFARPGDSLALAARAGRLQRNFQGYTTDDATALIGLGPSAISSFEEGIAQNAPATGAWQERLAAGRLTTVRGHALTAEDRLVAHVISRLMCDGAVDLAAASARFGAPLGDLLKTARAALDDLPGIGMLDGSLLRASGPGTIRLLAARFDPGFTQGGGAYSQVS